ncbi:MAG TPA: 4-oxalocrotonate tautomerase [Deltaproteobacteria bacterium]|nr:4-oxalocrotonate tautomerase [Deltaproteobacteria bacterium]
MPIVEIKLLEGRTLEQKKKLASAVTDAVVQSLGVNPDSVRITLLEMAQENYAVAGVLWIDSKK